MNLKAPIITKGDSGYAFASGVVRGKWAKRFSRAEFSRLLDSPAEEMGKTLSELGFHGADSDIEKALSNHWGDTVALIESLSRHPHITDVFNLYTDFTNASLVLKGALFGFDARPLYLDGGKAKFEDLVNIALGEKHSGAVPKDIFQSILVAKGLYSATKIPLMIDVAMDSYFGTIFVGRLFRSESEFLAEYARRWADAKNLTGYLRIRIAGLPIEDFKRFFVEGGHIPREEYSKFETLDIDGIPARLVFSPYGKALADAVAQLVKNETFEPLSNHLAYLLEEFLRQNIYITFGLEVLMSFGMLKFREIGAIGAIVRMKKANIPKERILQRVRYGDL